MSSLIFPFYYYQNQQEKKNLKLFLGMFIFLSFFFLNAFSVHAGITQGIAPVNDTLKNGLVGYWTFDGKNLSKTTAADSSGNKNHGTLTNSPRPISGRIGQGLNFDGVNDYVNLGTGLDQNGAMSISAWVNSRTVAAGVRNIVANDNSLSTQRDYQLEINRTVARFSFVWAGAVVATSNTNFVANQWYHVVAVRSGISGNWTATIYVDGKFDGSGTTATDPNGVNDQTSIGNEGANTGVATYFSGSIDDVRIYNRILSPAEIKRLYNMGAATKLNVAPQNNSLASGLVGYWTFDGKDMMGTSTAMDVSGNRNTGNLNNGVERVIGKIGQGLRVHGANDCVKGPVLTPSVYGTNAKSISVWIKPENFSTGDGGKIVNLAAGGGNGTRFFLRAAATTKNGNAFAVNVESHSISFMRNEIATSTWYHVVVTVPANRTSVDIKGYVNGIERAGITESGSAQMINTTSSIFSIGGSPNCLQGFNGSVDDVRVYNRVLSSAEIKRLYNMGAATKLQVAPQNNTLNQGLVGYWTFDGKDMVATTTAGDVSGNRNHGIMQNGVARTTGRIGQGLSFDGKNDFVLTTSSPLDPSINNVTASGWILFRGLAGDSVLIAQNDGTGTGRGWLYYDNNVARKSIVSNFGGVVTDSGFTPSLNKWYHLAVTNNSGIISLYIDGVLKVSASRTIESTNGSCIFGVNKQLTSYLNGSIDDVRIYNRVLTAAEIKRLYNMGR